MIRIPREQLDEAVMAFMKAALSAQNTAGLKIYVHIDQKKAEAAVLGAMSILAPNGGPCTAADVVFVHTPAGGLFGHDSVHFPPSIPGTDQKREEEKT